MVKIFYGIVEGQRPVEVNQAVVQYTFEVYLVIR